MAYRVVAILLATWASSLGAVDLHCDSDSCVEKAVTDSMLQMSSNDMGMRSIREESDVEEEPEEDKVERDTSRKLPGFVLHQKDKSSTVDGVLFMQDGTTFTEDTLKHFCSKVEVECLTDLPLAVARASVEDISTIRKKVPQLVFAELKDRLPLVVQYLKGHVTKEQLPGLLAKYKQAKVSLPVAAIVEEFKKEHENLA